MSSTAENPSAGRTRSCPYTLASPGMSPRKSRTAGPFSFKSTPPLLIGQTRACRGFQRFRPPLIRTLVIGYNGSADARAWVAREASLNEGGTAEISYDDPPPARQRSARYELSQGPAP